MNGEHVEPKYDTTEDLVTLDIGNRCMVSARGKQIVIMNPPTRMTELTPTEALLLAAWLVAMAEFNSNLKFEDVLLKVQNT